MALTARIEKRLGSFRLEVEVSAGDSLALLGASGCGKSLTLKCVAGVERPDRGRIELDGRVLFDSEAGIDLPPQKRRVGLLFQQYALFPHMTVEENLAVCLRGLEPGRRRQRLGELLARLRLEEQRKLYPRQLSGGQQQRTALARILASEPQAILLDEPLSALDSFLRWQLEGELREALEQFPGPVVWVTHDLGEARRNCRQVCVLDGGRSAPVTDLETLMRNPGTAAAARLSGCKNLVPVRPGGAPGTVEVPDWGLTLRCAAPWRAEAAALGLRGVRPAEEGEIDNVFLCQVLRVTEDLDSLQAALRPQGAAPGSPPLWMELSKGTPPPAGLLRVRVSPADLLLLE